MGFTLTINCDRALVLTRLLKVFLRMLMWCDRATLTNFVPHSVRDKVQEKL
jgi:hypothetical protein